MIGLDYKVDNGISKTTDMLALWRSEKGLVEIDKDTLTVGIRRNEKEAGYVFCGHGRLLIDTIVETDEGAIGKPVEKELNQPFILFSNTKEIHQHLCTASDEDVTRMGYTCRNDFVTEAEDLIDRFLERKWMHRYRHFGSLNGTIFVFSRKTSKAADVLVLNDDGFIYKAMDIVFLMNKDSAILKSPEQVVLSKHRRPPLVNR